MKRTIDQQFKALGIALVLTFLGACGNNSALEPDALPPTNVTTSPTVGTAAKRLCTKEMAGVTLDGLVDFVQPTEEMTNLEGKVTYCLTVSGGKATFRLEFEVDAGIFYIQFGYDKVLSVTKNSSSLEIIFQDGFGLVGIKGSGGTATVKYHNFPSYDQAVAEALAELKAHCSGPTADWTVAKCMGYGPPTPWWENPALLAADKIGQARTTLSNASKTSVLGQVTY